MTLPQLLDQFEPETDPDRRSAQIMLCLARTVLPHATISELVDFAILAAGRGSSIEGKRDLIEAVALEMALARGPEVHA